VADNASLCQLFNQSIYFRDNTLHDNYNRINTKGCQKNVALIELAIERTRTTVAHRIVSYRIVSCSIAGEVFIFEQNNATTRRSHDSRASATPRSSILICVAATVATIESPGLPHPQTRDAATCMPNANPRPGRVAAAACRDMSPIPAATDQWRKSEKHWMFEYT